MFKNFIRMKKVNIYMIIFSGILANIFISGLFSQDSWYEQANERIDTLRKGNFAVEVLDNENNPVSDTIKLRLKKHEFQFGTTVPMPGVTPDYIWAQATATKYYNYGVYGRFKWHYMEPSQGEVHYDLTDTVIKWAEKIGWELRAHTLLWGGDESWQMPSWTLDTTLTAEELYDACETRIKRDVAHYKGILKEYDVMNEPVHATWLSDKVGDSINWNSFKWANEADSSAVLYANEFNILVWGSMDAYRTAIQKMIDNGAPIGGIGLQGHMENNINVTEVKARLDTMAKFNLPIKITEFDMKVDHFNLSEQQQANAYAKMYRTVFSHPAVESILQWDFCDSWAYNAGAGIISENKIPKIAADSLYHLIHEQWSTDIQDTTNNQGLLEFKGFYGDYEVIVSINDTSRIFYIPAYRSNEDSVFTLSMSEGLPVPPVLIEARLGYDGTQAELIFDKDIDSTTLEKEYFHIYSMNYNQVTEARLKDGEMNAIILTFKYPILYRQVGCVVYNRGNVMSLDSGIMGEFGPEYIINKLPGYLMATTNNEGTAIEVTFTEKMEADIPVGNFLITVNDLEYIIDTAYLKEDDSTTIVFGLINNIVNGDMVFVSYEPGDYRSADGYYLGQFGPKYVFNRLTTSTGKNNLSQIITIYPNPFNDIFSLSNLGETEKIVLYNALGRIVNSYNLSGESEIVFNASDMGEGIYIIKCINKKGAVNILKITKN